jgi:hypothetical protein
VNKTQGRVMNRTELTQEWQVLQNQFDSYEKYSLVIKLLNVGIFFGAYVTDKLSITLVAGRHLENLSSEN